MKFAPVGAIQVGVQIIFVEPLIIQKKAINHGRCITYQLNMPAAQQGLSSADKEGFLTHDPLGWFRIFSFFFLIWI